MDQTDIDTASIMAQVDEDHNDDSGLGSSLHTSEADSINSTTSQQTMVDVDSDSSRLQTLSISNADAGLPPELLSPTTSERGSFVQTWVDTSTSKSETPSSTNNSAATSKYSSDGREKLNDDRSETTNRILTTSTSSSILERTNCELSTMQDDEENDDTTSMLDMAAQPDKGKIILPPKDKMPRPKFQHQTKAKASFGPQYDHGQQRVNIQNQNINQRIQIFLKTVNGVTKTIELMNNSTIHDLFLEVKQLTTIPINQLRLVYEGHELPSDERISKTKTLKDFRISKESTIHQLARLRGGDDQYRLKFNVIYEFCVYFLKRETHN